MGFAVLLSRVDGGFQTDSASLFIVGMLSILFVKLPLGISSAGIICYK